MFLNEKKNRSFSSLIRLRLFGLFLLLILIGPDLWGQSASFRKYSVLDGLPQSQVNNIFQDSRGFMWISTRNGLSRFDGIDFLNYYRANGLPDNQVVSIFEDFNGNIWALSGSGLSRYNGSGFDYFPPPTEIKRHVYGIRPSVDSTNTIFFIAESPANKYGRIIAFKNGVYSNYSDAFVALDTFNVADLRIDISSREMVILDGDQNIWRWKDTILSPLSPRKFQTIFQEKNDLLAMSEDTVFRFDGNDFLPFNFSPEARRFGVVKFTQSGDKKFIIFAGEQHYIVDLPFNFLAYWIDNQDVIWFSSEGNMFRLLSPAFSNISEAEIGSGTVWAIAEDRNGHIFFGSLYNTLVEFDGYSFRERKEFRNLFKKGISFYKGSRTMSNGDVWFSTNCGVLIWDGNSFSVLKGIPDNTQICYIYEDRDDKTVMIGTEKGLFIRRNNKMELLTDFTDSGLGVIEGVARDDSGIYWLSGHNGVVRFDGSKRIAVKESILPEEFTYTIEKDIYGGLWVTSETGLYLRKKGADHFIHGLPESVNTPVNSIISTDSLHILVGRVNDICIIDLKKFYENERDYFRTYDNTNGFMGSDCLDNGIIKDHAGRFWILTSDKTVIFDPRKLKENSLPPVLNITGIHYETDSLTWQPVDRSNFFYVIPPTINLNSHQNVIRISFSGISTPNPEKVMYQSRLEGYDKKWSLPSSRRFVVYEKLPPGHYRFSLKAFNADGVETVKPVTADIIVVPAIWQRAITKAIIYLLCMGAILSLSLFLIRRRQRRREEEAGLRYELSRLQMNSVLRQFDPHFTFNVISAIGSLIMKGEKENAYDYITILGGLLRTVLGEGSVIIKPLSDEIDFVRRYCELQKLRFNDRISFSIVIEKEVDLQRTIPKMTIQLFVENAIKHGFEDRSEGGTVDVSLLKTDSSLEIRIIDNGIGRAAAALQVSGSSGNGLKMINGLFDLMNSSNGSVSTIEITDLEENGKPSGTSVRILIPDEFRFEFGNSLSLLKN